MWKRRDSSSLWLATPRATLSLCYRAAEGRVSLISMLVHHDHRTIALLI
jgi:hypothetical protein